MASPAPIDEDAVQKIVAMIRHIASRTNEAITAAQLLPKVLQAADANTITAIADALLNRMG